MKQTFITIQVAQQDRTTQLRVYKVKGSFTAKKLKSIFAEPSAIYHDSIVLDDQANADNYRFAPGYATVTTIDNLTERYAN